MLSAHFPSESVQLLRRFVEHVEQMPVSGAGSSSSGSSGGRGTAGEPSRGERSGDVAGLGTRRGEIELHTVEALRACLTLVLRSREAQSGTGPYRGGA